MPDWLRRWLGIDRTASEVRRADLSRIDARLSALEREQTAIEVRLRLLERQADPRGVWETRGG
jgi:hypothetical protein